MEPTPDGPGMAIADRAARERIVSDLASTLFVEAGAGSGKTTALVERVVALVTSGETELRFIAAITFTEKAAAELRDRLRRALERQPEGEAAERCRVALAQLDGAAIGTLHSFAHRLLSEHPVEAGLPPRVEVLDEVSSNVAFDRRWLGFRDELLADRRLERTLLLLVAAGVRVDAIRFLAQAFDDNWDLVEERVPPEEPDPPSVHTLLDSALADVDTICASPCRDRGDKLRSKLDEIAVAVAELRAIGDEFDLLEALAPDGSLPSFKLGNVGKQDNFDCDLGHLRARVRAVGEALEEIRAEVGQACARRLGTAVREFTLRAAAERRTAGRLEFHDLLVLARSLLRDPDSGVRARLHGRYQRLLLDEFQDTDPIQIELAVRIAAEMPTSIAAGASPWEEVDVAAGHLFVVGDPKQSIYRFRRADISTFLAAAARFAPRRPVELTTNFRTVRPIIEWINATFAVLMSAREPSYVALNPVREASPHGPPIAVLGNRGHPATLTADELRAEEAGDVAGAVARAIDEGWDVEDSTGWRPAGFGDIAILVPSRTSLPFLEDALEAARIPFRAESSSLVYASRPVRDLLMVLRAVDDPTDYLCVVAALRTPLLACGDDDLFRFKRERGGHWSYLAEQPPTVPAEDPVRAGLEYLRSMYDQRCWLAPSELLDRIARDRRAMELGFAQGRPRDTWRRLRFVIDQARAWMEATSGNLRQYLHWGEQQKVEGGRVAESILPETDDDAVRIMTIHSAKGLEFPITIVSGMSTVPQARPAPAQVVFPAAGGVGYRLGRHVKTDEYRAWLPIDEQMGYDERIRLLYVACTRARDHLIVSLHRKAHATDPAPIRRTNAELLFAAGPGTGAVADLPEPAGSSRLSLPGPTRPAPATPARPVRPTVPPERIWAAERAAALARASQPSAVAATALTDDGTPDPETDPGLQKRPRDLDLPPWLKGRYGTAVGRAVHGVLQTIDLATGAGLDQAVSAQCQAEAVVDQAADVRRLVRHALGSPSVREAAARPHWREVYACTPIDGRLLEGYIDLLYRGPDGLVVVDYKTAHRADSGELDRRIHAYRSQGASYALAVEAAAGEPVTRVTFVFLTPAGAIERHLGDLQMAVAEVDRLVRAGRELLVD